MTAIFLIWKGDEKDKRHTTAITHKFHWLYHLQHLQYESFKNVKVSPKLGVLWAVHHVETFHSR